MSDFTFTSGLREKNGAQLVGDSDGDVFLRVWNGHTDERASIHVTHEGLLGIRAFIDEFLAPRLDEDDTPTRSPLELERERLVEIIRRAGLDIYKGNAEAHHTVYMAAPTIADAILAALPRMGVEEKHSRAPSICRDPINGQLYIDGKTPDDILGGK